MHVMRFKGEIYLFVTNRFVIKYKNASFIQHTNIKQ